MKWFTVSLEKARAKKWTISRENNVTHGDQKNNDRNPKINDELWPVQYIVL